MTTSAPGGRWQRSVGAVTAIVALFAALGTAAQRPGPHAAGAIRPWSEVSPASESAADSPLSGALRYRLDRTRLEAWLADEAATLIARAPSGSAIELPVGGRYETYVVHPVPVLAPELAERHPHIHTLSGAARDAPERRVRITVTPDSFHARIFLRHEALIVTRAPGAEDLYVTVPEHSLRSPTAPLRACGTAGALAGAAEELHSALPGAEDTMPPKGFEDLTVYRLAVAATSAFTRANGGSVASALGRIAIAVNSVNEIFERDVGASFLVVPESERVIFTDHRDDPFLTDDPEELLERSQTVLDCRVGAAGYDIGHVLNAAGHNLARLAVAGRDGLKGRGATGIDSDDGNLFDLVYLAHELGHQLGAGHTYTGTAGECTQKVFEPASAVEPGSGSTIMSYAGLCAGDDLQAHSDPYFHARSVEQIIEYRRGRFAALQPPATPLGNSAPRVAARAPARVPQGTPFRLWPEAVEEPDGDLLTYTWEQVDRAGYRVARGDGCCAASYRSVPPSTIDGQENPGFAAPCRQSCDLTFALMVRDNRPGGGGATISRRTVHVDSRSGPFRITRPTGGIHGPGTVEVRWDVAATDVVLGIARVEVALLCNGSEVFALEGANDGYHLLRLRPGFECASAEVEVRPAEGIFFARSPPFRVVCEEP